MFCNVIKRSFHNQEVKSQMNSTNDGHLNKLSNTIILYLPPRHGAPEEDTNAPDWQGAHWVARYPRRDALTCTLERCHL